MRKMLKTSAFILALLVSVPALYGLSKLNGSERFAGKASVSEANAIGPRGNRDPDPYTPVGDLLGGIRGSEEAYGGFMIKQTASQVDLSDSDIFIRIKNNEATTRWPMIHIASDWFVNRVVTANGQKVERYNVDGELVATATVNEWGYFELPASFDGFIKVNWDVNDYSIVTS